MPLFHNGSFNEPNDEECKSWVPEEFTSVPRSSPFAIKPVGTLQPMTLEKIGWSEELSSFLKPATAEKPVLTVQTADKNITPWRLPEISDFAPRKKDQHPLAVENTAAVNTAMDYAEKIKKDAEQEAGEILETARARAAEIESAGLKEAEERRQQAYLDGMEASRQEAAAILKSAQTVLEEAHRWKQQIMTESEPAVIDMIKSISQDLFGEGYVLNVQEIEAVITRAIGQASRLGDLRVYLNPVDAQLIISLWQESEILLNGQKIALVSSQNIERGGCFIDGQYGMVDSRVSEQLSQIHKSLDTTLADSQTVQE